MQKCPCSPPCSYFELGLPVEIGVYIRPFDHLQNPVHAVDFQFYEPRVRSKYWLELSSD